MQESYTLTQAMGLAGISPGNLANWRRRYPELEENPYITPRRGNKRSASLDLTGVIYLAIIGRVNNHGLGRSNKLGLGPVEAARCADRFLHLLQAHGADIHETFKRQWLLVVDHGADKQIEARALAATAAAIDFVNFPNRVRIILNLNSIYEEAISLSPSPEDVQGARER